jgi:hypothetical protein
MMTVQAVSPFYGGTTLEAFGAFGVGDAPGTSILGSWDYFMEVDNNSTFSASSIPVFSMEIPLTAGVDYWMTDDLETAATVVTPEPGVMALFATGMLALSGLRLYRRRKGRSGMASTLGDYGDVTIASPCRPRVMPKILRLRPHPRPLSRTEGGRVWRGSMRANTSSRSIHWCFSAPATCSATRPAVA